jgi:hypothetical protein
MKIGIYLSGLGEAFTHEKLERYARRFARQYDFFSQIEKATYEVHSERFEYDPEHQLISNHVTILEHIDGSTNSVYTFYEYTYAEPLTKRFKSKNALVKTWLLFWGVFLKFPMILGKLFRVNGSVSYNARFRGQALYLFSLFLIVSLAILILLPSALAVILNVTKHDKFLHDWLKDHHWTLKWLKMAVKILPSFTALFLLLMPGFNDAIVSLACEFVSASNYLDRGDTKQNIHGQIDLLLEKIIEKEGSDSEIYFHSYSFGSLISIDYLFPYGVEPSTRMKQHFKGLITIGSPVEFIKVYYPRFFTGRNLSLVGENQWLNVYSLADALGSNFRNEDTAGTANYSIQQDAALPVNINYEVANIDSNIFWQFLSLYALKAHGNYWDNEDNGQSCLRLVIPEMQKREFI